MKRTRAILLSGALVGILLGIGQICHADNMLDLSSSQTTLNPGDTWQITGSVTPHLPGATSTTKISALQGILVFDPTIFTATFTLNTTPGFIELPNDNTVTTFTYNNTTYTAIDAVTGITDRNKQVLKTMTAFGEYDLKVKSDTTFRGQTQVFFSSANIANITKTADKSLVTSTPASKTAFTINGVTGSVLTINIGAPVPGPSALLVFAMGGIAPAAGLLRRRLRVSSRQ